MTHPRELFELNTSPALSDFDIEKDMLTFYRITRLNWNSSTYGAILTSPVAYGLSKIKLYCTDVNGETPDTVKRKLEAREPTLHDKYYFNSLNEIPLWSYTETDISALETDINNQLERLTANQLSRVKTYADMGNPIAAFWQAFRSSKNNPVEAKKYLEQAAEKNDLAKFILIRNQLFGNGKCGIHQNIDEALQKINHLRSHHNDLYVALSAGLLFEAIRTNIINMNNLDEDLKRLVQPLWQDHITPVPSVRGAMPKTPNLLIANILDTQKEYRTPKIKS